MSQWWSPERGQRIGCRRTSNRRHGIIHRKWIVTISGSEEQWIWWPEEAAVIEKFLSGNLTRQKKLVVLTARSENILKQFFDCWKGYDQTNFRENCWNKWSNKSAVYLRLSTRNRTKRLMFQLTARHFMVDCKRFRPEVMLGRPTVPWFA